MREELDRSIEEVRGVLSDMAERADAMLDLAAQALARSDRVAAVDVIAMDGPVDELYTAAQQQVLTTVALHGPAGRDLRLLAGFLHVSLHLERMADSAVSIAKSVRRSSELPSDPELIGQATEMTGYARDVASLAMRSLLTLDGELARQAPELDDRVDRLHLGILHRLVALAAEQGDRLPWAAEMFGVVRRIERYADHAVDIAEQVVFVVSGEIVELSSNEND
jgi:phosphate transport system protein